MTPRWAVRICSCLGLGLVGKAPGTVASAMAVAVGVGMMLVCGPLGLLLLALGVGGLGWYACRDLPAADEDPGWVVIDEVAGQWLALAFAPLTLGGILAAFVLFRLFDIWKPWPVSWADQKLSGATSIMLDDLLAGGYAALILLIVGMF